MDWFFFLCLHCFDMISVIRDAVVINMVETPM